MDKNWEQRSEKTKKILGHNLSSLLTANIAVFIVVIVALLVCAALIEYPYGQGESILRHLLSPR